jgi:hypothetical protein
MFPGTRHQHARYVLNCYLVSLRLNFQIFIFKNPEKGINPSGSIKASLDTNKSIEIEWSPLSAECIDYNSGVWIRVFESGTSSSEVTYLAIPRKCLKEQSNTTFSLVVHSPSSTKSDGEQFEENDCHFELKNVLIECRAYTVELVPNYDSLKGRSLTTEIVIPSTVEYINHYINKE